MIDRIDMKREIYLRFWSKVAGSILLSQFRYLLRENESKAASKMQWISPR